MYGQFFKQFAEQLLKQNSRQHQPGNKGTEKQPGSVRAKLGALKVINSPLKVLLVYNI